MWIRFWIGICFVVLAAGCSQSDPSPETTNELRVLSLSPSNTELIFAIGAGELLVGRTINCDHPNETVDVPSVGSLFPPDFERILSVRPNVVIMSNGNIKVRDRLKRLNIRVVVIDPKSVDDIAGSMRQLGAALGREVDANRAAVAFEKSLKALSRKGHSNQRVLYEISQDPMMIPGQATFLADLIRHSGGQPVGTKSQGDWPKVNKEWVLTADPQIFLVADDQRGLALKKETNPLRNTSAIRNNAVYTVPDPDILVRPGPRILDGIRWLRTILDGPAQ